jgi:hypothetical protein
MLPDIDIPTVHRGSAASVSCGPGSRQVESGSAGGRRRARQKANDLADFASAQIPSLLPHDAIGEREPDALSAQLPQGFGIRRARRPALMTGGAALLIERFAG